MAERIHATAPDAAAWDGLPSGGEAWDVTIVVPVYGGHAETMRCLWSVLQSRALAKTRFELLVINDASPEPEITNDLRRLAAQGLFAYIEHQRNLGFVASVNEGLSKAGDRDVVILNSDTEVHNDWLDRLRAHALSGSNVASVTPFSNNAEICSYPLFVKDYGGAFEIADAELDALAAQVNARQTVEIPTGVGFCMYMPAAAIRAVGLFDEEAFGRGYGEENDWCQRAVQLGLVNLLACDVFVRHYGAASFGADKLRRIEAALEIIARRYPRYLPDVRRHIAVDPARRYRDRLDGARLRLRAGSGRILLFVSHDRGGGTERHLRDLADLAVADGNVVLFCRPLQRDRNYLRFDMLEPIAPLDGLRPILLERDQAGLAERLASLGVDLVHIHHLIDFPHAAADAFRTACEAAGLPYLVTVHDYFYICPRVTLTDGSGVYCGEPEPVQCERCILTWGAESGRPAVWDWRARFERLLRGAAGVMTPSADAATRLRRYVPDLPVEVRPHWTSYPALGRAEPKAGPGVRNILVIGAISGAKGSGLIEAVARYAWRQGLPLSFTVLGYTDRPLELSLLPNVTVLGAYDDRDAPALARAQGAEIAWFPAVWPETWCYTLDVAFAAGLYPVAFDLGAVAERIRAVRGSVMPIEMMFDVDLLAEALLQIRVPDFPPWPGAVPPPGLAAYYGGIGGL